MSEVNLKDYFNRLDNLLGENAADEVIHHCRHILRYYPKNVNTYRFLGQALVLIGRWDEAQAALRRVLSVIPDDFAANVTLGEVFDHTNRCDDAIWHLERALDQRPNDRALLDALRVLYQRCRHTGQLKIQMTAGSVAQQHRRAGSGEYAVETLRLALKQSPDRVDLRLLLAEILWEMGREDEAAENALDVLKTLPDCLAANRILAQLWLSFDRPSDAQPYVNRIESVDPYLAVELVQGTPPEDDAFRIDELDFQRSAQSEMVSSRPDWLSDLGASATSEPSVDESSLSSQNERASWSSKMLSSQPTSPEPALEENDLEWLGAFPMQQDQGFSPSEEDLMSDDDLESLFGNPAAAPPSPPPARTAPQPPSPSPAELDDENPFAWMASAGVELSDEPVVEEAGFPNFFEESDVPIPEQNVDPLAWMQPYGNDLLIDDESSAADGESFYNSGAGQEQSSQPPYPYAAEPQNTLEELDWLRSSSDNDDAFADSENEFQMPTSSEPAPGSLRGLTSILSEANLDWMQKPEKADALSSDEEMDDWLNQFGPPKPARAPVTDTPDWLTSLEDKPPSADIDFGAELDFGDNASTASAENTLEAAFDTNEEELVWMSESERPENQESPEDADFPDWLSEFEPKEEAEASTPSPVAAAIPETNDDFSWSNLSTYEEKASESDETSDDDIPDWLREVAPAAPEAKSEPAGATIGGTDFDWLTDDALASAEVDAANELSLEPGDDWLSELAPETGSSLGGTSIPAMAEEVAAEVNDLDWLNDLGGAAAVESVSDAEVVSALVNDDTSGIFDPADNWLSELAPEAEPSLGGTSIPEMAEEVAAEVNDLDWLNDLGGAAAVEPALNAVGNDDADASLEPSDDWLSELTPAEAEVDLTGPSIPAMAQEVAAEVNDLDWLNDLGGAAVEPALNAVGNDDVDASLEPGDDWLSEFTPTAEVDLTGTSIPEMAQEVAAEVNDLDWLNDLGVAAAVEPALNALGNDDADASLEPGDDWLSEFTPEAEIDLTGTSIPEMAEEVAAEVNDLDWLDGLQTDAVASTDDEVEEAAEAVGEGTPDWLSDLQPAAAATASVDEVEEAAVSEETDWLADLQPVNTPQFSDIESVAPAETPDWLTEIQPEETVAAVAANETTGEEETFDWLDAMPAVELPTTSLSDEVTASFGENYPEAAAAVPVEDADFSDWLSGLAPVEESAAVVRELEPEAELADWEAAESEPVAVTGAFDADTGEEDTNDAAWSMPSPDFENGDETLVFRPNELDLTETLEGITTEDEFEDAFGVLAGDAALDSLDEFADEDDEIESPVSDFSEFDDVTEDEDAFELFNDEELVPTPADNAPDWLNAMVPGLDVDYEAQENVLPEEEFEEVELPAASAEPVAPSEFGWLERIVDEEIEADTAALAAAAPRFVFSRPPAWMQSASQQDDDLPDWPVDEDDTPDWLR